MGNAEAATLRVRGGPNDGMTIILSGEGALILGRGSDNDLDTNDQTVSRRHALIMETPEGFIVRDLGSANGTFVNREKVGREERLLSNGDKIRLAGSRVSLLFRRRESRTVKMAVKSSEEEPVVDDVAFQPDAVDGRQDPELTEEATQLLGLLESCRYTAVSRQDIASHVWPNVPPDQVLQSQRIDRTVLGLRAHLHDDPRRPSLLITAGEYGYLLV